MTVNWEVFVQVKFCDIIAISIYSGAIKTQVSL